MILESKRHKEKYNRQFYRWENSNHGQVDKFRRENEKS